MSDTHDHLHDDGHEQLTRDSTHTQQAGSTPCSLRRTDHDTAQALNMAFAPAPLNTRLGEQCAD